MIPGKFIGKIFGIALVFVIIVAVLGSLPGIGNSVAADSKVLPLAYESVITHEGDLIVEGTEIFVVENCTYIQSGRIIVRGHGKLAIRNAQLEIDQTEAWQYEVRVSEFGTLELQEATVTSNYPIEMNFVDYSKAYIVSGSIPNRHNWIRFLDFTELEMSNSNFCEIQMFHNSVASIVNSALDAIGLMWCASNVEIADSEIRAIELRFERASHIQIDGLVPGSFASSDVEDIVQGARFHLGLKGTSVDHWRAYAYFDSETTIANSRIHLSISFQSISASIDGANPGLYSYAVFGGITLHDTFLTGIILHDVIDSHITVTNSTAQLIPFGESFLCIDNSVVDGLFTTKFSGSLSFQEATWKGGIIVYFSDFSIYGDVSFKDFGVAAWQQSNITREYGVLVKDSYGNVISDAHLTLRSEDDTQVWSGTTDSQGRANFDITFTDGNYTDTLRLEAVKGNMFDAQDITFLSDTPVILTVLAQYNLAISSTAGGSVTNPGEGTFTYDQGTGVNLVAEAEKGYRFVNWTGDVATIADIDDASTTITINGDYSITANFEPIPEYTLTISSTAGGSVTSPGEGDFAYEEGTWFYLVAKADEGYRFVNWTGDVDTIADVNAASTTITMNGDYSITARFQGEEPEPPMTPYRGCFIATAAYGTPMAEEIQILREFRDEYLLTNPLGHGLTDIYYRISPPIADFITDHPSLKLIVRAGLMPIVAMCTIVFEIVPQFVGNEA